MLREALAQAAAKLRGLRERRPRRGGQVRDQTPLPRPLLAGRHHRLAHLVHRQEVRLDLPRLDAEAADLDLLVDAPQELQRPVRQPAHPVAGAVQPRAGRVGEGVGDEALRGQLRAAQVAARQQRAAQVQVARGAERRGEAGAVQDVGRAGREEPADRHHRAGEGAREAAGHLVHGGAHHPLGGAVAVDQAGGVRGPQRAAHRGGGEGVPAQEEEPDAGHGAAAALHHLVPVGRGEVGDGDAERARPLRELRRAPRLARADRHRGAGQQRHEDLLQRHVEAGGGEVEHPVLRPQPQHPPEGQEVRRRGPVLHHHALGPPRRPGGVDQVGGVAREHLRRGRVRRPVPVLLHAPARTQEEHLAREVREHPRRLRVGDHQPHPGVGQHVGQALRGVGGVQREVDAARLEDRHRRHGHPRVARGAGGHAALRPHASGAEEARQPLRAPVQLRVREPLVPGHGGQGLRRAPDPRLERAVQEEGAGALPFRARPLRQEAALLLAGKLRFRHGTVRRLRHPLQERPVVAEHPLHGGAVEQVGAVGQGRRQPLAVLHHGERQVEHRRLRLPLQRLHAEPARGRPPAPRLLEGEHHLEEGGVPERALGVQLLHQLLEGDVLVRVRLQHAVAHAGQQLARGGGAGQVGAHHQRVDEEADQVLRLHPRPPRDGGPHQHVVLPGPARQERLPPGQERHEERAPLLPGEAAEGARGAGREEQGARGALHSGDGGARPVGGDLQKRGRALQPLPPVGELPLQRLPREPGALPGGVVRVLHRELGEHGRAPGEPRLVHPGHLGHQQLARPPVADDVVQRQEERPLLPVQPRQPGAQERPPRQVEGAHGLLAGQAQHLGVAIPGGEAAQVGDRERHRGGGEDHLHRLPALRAEHGAQRLVPPHHLAERAAERRHVQRAVQPQGVGDVVGGGPGLQLVDEPEALLRERQRERGAVARDGHHRRSPGPGALVQERVHLLRQPGHRGGLEESPQRHLHPERLAHPRDHPRGDQRVPAQREEVVLRPHALHPQHRRVDPGQDLLRRRARRDEVLPALLRLGERPAVHLPVGSEGKPLQHHQRGRDHVLREPLLEPAAQLRHRRAGALRDHVPHQPLAAHHHRRLAHLGVPLQHRLHLAGLDAEAAHLDLEVHAPDVVQLPVRAPAHPVARAVHPRPDLPRVRVGDEALRRQLRAAQVAARDPGAAHVQLARDADGDGAPLPVQEVDAHVRHRPPDADPFGDLHPRDGGVDRGLGGSVVVPDRRVRVERPRPLHQLRAERLAAQEHRLEPPGLRGLAGADQLHHGAPQRRHPAEGDALAPGDRFQQRPRVGDGLLGEHPHGLAAKERREELPHVRVEAQPGDQREVEALLAQHFAVEPGQVVDQPAVLDEDALGGPGGAGGVDDVRQVAGGDGGGFRRGERGRPRHVHPRSRERLQPPLQRRVRHQRARAGVLQHEEEALVGVAGVQREVGGAGPEDAEDADDGVRAPLQEEPHAVVGADALRPEPPGERARARLQLRVGQAPAAGDHRHRVRRARGLLRDQLVDAALRGEGAVGGVPGQEELRPLVRRQQVQLREAAVRAGGGAVQEADVVVQQPLGGGPVEQVGAEHQPPGQAVPGLVRRQAQVEAGQGRAQLQRLRLQRTQAELLVLHVLHGEHDLEERRVPQGALRLELLHQLLEGEVLVLERAQRVLAHAPEQRAEGGVAREVGAEHQRVDEEADQLLQLRAGAPRDRGPHGDVLLARPARQQRLEPRQHRHEERGALPARQRPQRPRGPGRQLEGAALRVRRGRRGAGPVGGQLQRRGGARQRPAPPGELRLQRLADQPVALPHREVGVLHRERRERRLAPFGEGAVQLGHLAHQHRHAPPVGDDVVHGEEHPPLLLAQPRQEGAHQRPLREVEGALRLGRRQAPQLRLALRGGEGAQVLHRDGRGPGRADHLHRLAVAGAREDGAERLVPLHQHLQRALQRLHPHRAAHPQREGHVVDGAPRLQLVDEPQSLLRERERELEDALVVALRPDGAVPRLRHPGVLHHQRQELGPLRGEVVSLHGSAHHRAEGVHPLGERRQDGGLEQDPERDLHAERVAETRHHPRPQERVPPQLEEGIARAHPAALQQPGPDGGDRLLRGGARRHVLPAVRRAVGRGEGAPRHLAAGGEREGVQRHQRGGDHVLREALRQPCAQLRRRGRGGALRGDHVPHQAPLAGLVLAHHGHRPRHGGVPLQHRLHLAGLHPEAAHLGLVVGPPQELQLAPRRPARAVAGAVRARAGLRRERVREEALRGQLRPPQVAARQAAAAQVQLPRDAHGRRAEVAVQDVGAGVGDGAADGGEEGPLLRRALQRVLGGDVRLGGAVLVAERRAGGRQPAPHRLRHPELLPGRDHLAQGARTGPAALRLLGQLLEGDEGEEDPLHLLTVQQLQERGGVAAALLVHQHQAPARGPGGEDLLEGDVEAERGELEGRGGGEARRPELPRHQAHQRAVRHRHALGSAGGAGRVDDVRQVVGPDGGLGRLRGSLPVHRHHLPRELREALRDPRLRHDRARAGAGEHVRQALGGVAGVQGDVGGPGLEDPQHGHHHLRPALQAEPHPRVRPHSQRAQPPREPAGAELQLRVGQRAALPAHRHRVRRPARLRLHQVVGARRVRTVRRGVVPLLHDEAALRLAQQLDLRDAPLRVRGNPGQQRRVVLQQPVDGGVVEQLRAELGGPRDPLAVVPQPERQVELGLAGPRLQRLRLHPAQAQLRLHADVLDGEEDLEERGVAERALHAQLFHQALEGEVLVLLGLDDGGAGPRQQLVPGGVVRQVGPQHQRVHEEADQPLQLRAPAVRHRSPHQHVVLPGPARQQRLPPRQQRGEGRGPRGARQRVHGGRGPGGELEAAHSRPRRRDGRAGAVGGELQERGGARQAPAPEGELRLQRLSGEGAALPQGVVRVLHREIRERGGLPAGEGAVQGGHLAHQHRGGPGVADHVVHGEERHRLLAAGAEEPRAQERPARQVEGAGGLRARQPPELRLGEPREVDHLDAHRLGGAHGLHRLPVGLGEDGAEHLVAADHLGERARQRLHLQRAAQPHRDGDVVGRASGLQPVEEPEPLLRERQREPLPAQGPLHRRAAHPLPRGRVHARGEGGQRGRLEHRPQRHLHAQRLAHPRDHPRAQEGVAAQLEEAVARAHPGGAQDVGPDLRHGPLRGGARLHVGGLVPRGPVGRREGAAGQLPGRGARERVQRHHRRGHQVLREPLAQPAAQLRGGGRLPRAGHHVGHQALLPRRVLPHHHHGLAHGGVLQERGLDLPRLHPEPAQLDLLVRAPQVLQPPLRQPPRPVPRPVHPRPRLSPERVRDEPLRRQLRPPQVPPRQLRARQVQLPRHPHRRRRAPALQHVRPHVRHRPPDREGRPPLLPRRHVPRRVDARLRRPVQVHHLRPRQRPCPRRRSRRERFAPAEDPPHPPELPEPRLLQQHLQLRGDELHHGHPLRRHRPHQLRGVALRPRRGQHQLGPRQQRRPQLPHRGVEAEGGLLEHTVPRPQRELLPHPRHVVGQRPVRHRHPLRPPRGPRGVDDVGERAGGDGHPGRGVGLGTGRRLVHQDGVDRVGREPLRDGPGREEHPGPRVLQHPGQPLGGVLRVQRHVRGAGLQHPQHGRYHLGPALHADPHPRLRTHPAALQVPREPVRLPLQLRVALRSPRPPHRHRVRRPPRLRREALVHEPRAVERPLRRVPLLHHPAPLALAQQPDLGDAPLRVRRHPGQQRRVVLQQPLHRGPVEQLRPVLRPPDDPLPGVHQAQQQVELGAPRLGVQQLHLHAAQAEDVLSRGALEAEHDLEERRVGQRPLRDQLLHQPLEGNVLVLLRVPHRGAGARQQLADGGIVGEVGPQHQRVHQEADQPLQLRPAAVRHGGAHQHVVLPRPARQQRLPGGKPRREERRPLGVRQRPERRGGPGVQRERARPGLHGGAVGPGTVRRQLQDGRSPGQPLPPVGELRLQRLLRQGAALPHGVVDVLDRQLRERGRLAAGEGVVQRRQLADQDPGAPLVAHDVVQRQQRHHLVRARAEEPRAQERPARQVERPRRLLARLRPDRLLPLLRRERGKVGDLHAHGPGLADHLHRLPVDLGEDGVQRLVPEHDLAERLLQRAHVERPAQPQREGDVVRRASGLQAVHQPEPLLREGEGEVLLLVGRALRGDVVGVRRRQPLVLHHQREELELLRGQLQRVRRQLVRGRLLLRGGRPERVHALGEGGERGRLEHRPQRHLHPQRLAEARDHPGPEQRVPAQLEEAVAARPPAPPAAPRPRPPRRAARWGCAAPRTPWPPPHRRERGGRGGPASRPGCAGARPAPPPPRAPGAPGDAPAASRAGRPPARPRSPRPRSPPAGRRGRRRRPRARRGAPGARPRPPPAPPGTRAA